MATGTSRAALLRAALEMAADHERRAASSRQLAGPQFAEARAAHRARAGEYRRLSRELWPAWPAVVLLSTEDGEPDADATEAAARALATDISIARDGAGMVTALRPDGQVVICSRGHYAASTEPLRLRSVHYGQRQSFPDGQPITDPPDAETFGEVRPVPWRDNAAEWGAADLSQPDALQLRAEELGRQLREAAEQI
jgi:hypothetical protein